MDHLERRERRQIRQREELVQERREPGSLWHDVRYNPYLSTTVGLILCLPATAIVGAMALEDSYFPELFVPWIPTAALFARGIWQLRQWRPKIPQSKLGSEKQLLLTIATTGGSITPVEAALETSLTVDEAEEILSRLADRGHLIVQSHDGTLFYTLPARRTGALDGRTAPNL